MKNVIGKIGLFYAGCAIFSCAVALEFSKDTLNAFDGKWHQGPDDSIIIRNRSNGEVTIDSIQIQIDDLRYRTFDISWIFGKSVLAYTNNPDTSLRCPHRSILINEYNSGQGSKIRFDVHQNIAMQSPYFSKICSIAGVLVDCFGPCYPINALWHYTYFPGRIIFFSQGHRDTLNLNCEYRWYTTGVINRNAAAVKQRSSVKHSATFDMLGRRINPTNKLEDYHSVLVRKGRINADIRRSGRTR